MADLNEEQLLTELLRDVGAADTTLAGPDLEARVLAAWDAAAAPKRGRTPFSRAYYVLGIAAAVTLAVVATTWQGTISTPPASAPALASASAASPASAAAPASASAATPLPPPRLRRYGATSRRDKPIAVASHAPSAPDAPSAPVEVAESPLEFIPLVPMTERELAGPFQIVRVQMPRASLGRMTSPMHHPSELIEADLLLGEDGMARAIHVSTSGSVSPWRSR